MTTDNFSNTLQESTVAGKLSPVWLKAAVVGGLWASAEIILGSFLHNLRIPLAGSVLASIGTILLIAFHCQWPEKGLIWRAGLICALMKSISPSSVILGPMIGIMLEALLLEMSLRILGRNPAGYIVGGILSVSSALMHKIFSLLIMYGNNVVEIYKNIFVFAARQLKISDADPLTALLFLVLAYVVLGLFVSVTGLLIGSRALKFKGKIEVPINNWDNAGEQDRFRSGQTSLFKLILSVVILILFLIFQDQFHWIAQFALVGVLVVYGMVYYRKALRRLKKMIFWLQLLIMIFLAVFFTFNREGQPDYLRGLIAGLEMSIRALFVVLSFSVISVEIRNPIVKMFLVKKGYSQLYQSLNLSFSALPLMMDHVSKTSAFLKHPVDSLARIVQSADSWLNLVIRMEFLRTVEIRQISADELMLMNVGFEHFEKISGYRIAKGSLEFPEFTGYVLDKIEKHPADKKWWLPFLMILEQEKLIIGMCGYKGAPDQDGFVEIGYGVAHDFRRHGIASYAAGWLIRNSYKDSDVQGVIAHTLPEENVSVKVLRNNGFVFVGETYDPDEGKVWRWKKVK